MDIPTEIDRGGVRERPSEIVRVGLASFGVRMRPSELAFVRVLTFPMLEFCPSFRTAFGRVGGHVIPRFKVLTSDNL